MEQINLPEDNLVEVLRTEIEFYKSEAQFWKSQYDRLVDIISLPEYSRDECLDYILKNNTEIGL